MYKKTGKGQKATIAGLGVAGLATVLIAGTSLSNIIFLSVAALSSSLYVFLLGTRSRWSLTPAGRAEFFAFLSFSVLIDWILLGFFIGTDWTYRNEIRVYLFLGFALATVNLVVTIRGVQRRELRDAELALLAEERAKNE